MLFQKLALVVWEGGYSSLTDKTLSRGYVLTKCAIIITHWIEIYLVDSDIHPLTNQGLICKVPNEKSKKHSPVRSVYMYTLALNLHIENLLKINEYFGVLLNPLMPMSDQDKISPYNINTKSRRQVMRTKKSVNSPFYSCELGCQAFEQE